MNVRLVTFGSAAVSAGDLPVEFGEGQRGAECCVADADAGILNEVLRSSSADAVVLCDVGGIPEGAIWEAGIRGWQSGPTAQAGLFWLPTAGLQIAATWSALPCRLAALLFPPERLASVVVRKAAIENIGGFRDVSAPLWDALIRIAQTGGQIVSLHAEQAARSASGGAEYGPVEGWLPRLVPGRAGRDREWLRAHLSNIQLEDVPGAERGSSVEFAALQAGLWQLHDFLEESHQCSQGIEGRGVHRAGDYWHAIMHRREPDYSNSKYWFRRVGRHPVFPSLCDRAAEILELVPSARSREWVERLCGSGSWDPFAFVDLCAECAADESGDLALAARRIQFAEMLLLIVSTFGDLGGTPDTRR